MCQLMHRHKGRKFRLYMLAIGLLVFLVWAAGEWLDQQTLIEEHQAELVKVRAESEAANQRHLELKEQVERLHDPAYIAEVARRDYFLTKDGEMIFNVSE